MATPIPNYVPPRDRVCTKCGDSMRYSHPRWTLCPVCYWEYQLEEHDLDSFNEKLANAQATLDSIDRDVHQIEIELINKRHSSAMIPFWRRWCADSIRNDIRSLEVRLEGT